MLGLRRVLLLLPPMVGIFATGDNALLARLQSQHFVHVTGRNPILRADEDKGVGEGKYIEMGDIIRDFETYYLYFHGSGMGGGYSIGVATSHSPLGPWTMYEGNPILAASEPWEGGSLAMGSLLKRGVAPDGPTVPPLFGSSGPSPAAANATFHMWYCAGPDPSSKMWTTGLATAPTPLGPWTRWKYPDGRLGGPVMNMSGAANFSGNREGLYNTQVLEVNGSFLMYGEAMSGPYSSDQQPIPEYLGGVGMWRSQLPEGPFSFAGFALVPGGFGSWNDGGTSGGSVRSLGGAYEMWFSGSKMRRNGRILPREEDAGVAYSLDGLHWSSAFGNPVLPHTALPVPTSALAEIHVLYEHPFRYIYHTQRWTSDAQDKEDIGVEVMIESSDLAGGFHIPLPIIAGQGALRTGAPLTCGCHGGAAAKLPCAQACIATSHTREVVFTLRWSANSSEGSGKPFYNISIALSASLDGEVFDTEPCMVISGITGIMPSPTSIINGMYQKSIDAVDVGSFAGRYLSVSVFQQSDLALSDFSMIATLIGGPQGAVFV